MATESEQKIDVSGTEKEQKAAEKRQEAEEKEVECTVTKNNTQIKDRSYMKGDKVKLKVKELRLLDIQGVHVDHPKLPEIKDEE
jgi:hypothetical protein